LRHCDTLYLELRNTAAHPIDFGVFYIDVAGEAYPYGPHARGTRLAPREATRIPLQVVTWHPTERRALPVGVGRVVIVGLARATLASQAEAANFAAWLGLAEESTATGPLAALLAGRDAPRTRTALGVDPAATSMIRVIRWETMLAQ
jgi:hypothetical protein